MSIANRRQAPISMDEAAQAALKTLAPKPTELTQATTSTTTSSSDEPTTAPEASASGEAPSAPDSYAADLAVQRRRAQERAWQQIMASSGIPPRFQEAHLSTNCEQYAHDTGKEKALAAAQRLAKEGLIRQRGRERFCLLLSGPYGTGKTWLATAAFKELLYRQKSGLWQKYYAFIRSVQASYGASSDTTTEAVLGRYRRTPVLLLDDVGDLTVEQETRDRRNLLYEMLDYRNDHLLPTLITTNLGAEELRDQFGERTMQRILEMCALIGMDGQNLRF